ncbi:hypothetical protein HK097_008853 [Rhizophlyctis rosea]|uniref:HMG box domain-containing protein n=1 Tax=Rhizophlyctis rosea TaxID=64517 RepID=A0AAD5X3P1_9FUNG|nr:hypothetical protein HK097_008853 [Rhizophlyctis rosea]
MLFVAKECADGKAGLKATAAPAAKKWKELPTETKQEFKDLAAAAKADWDKQMAAYLEKRTPADALLETQIRKLKLIIHPNRRPRPVVPSDLRPKAPIRPYSLFCQNVHKSTEAEQMKVTGQNLKALTFAERAKCLGFAWKNLPSEERARYSENYRLQKENYDRDLKLFEERYHLDLAKAELSNVKKEVMAKVAKEQSTKARKGKPQTPPEHVTKQPVSFHPSI